MCLRRSNLFWRSLRHYFTPLGAAFGAHIDDPIGAFDDVEVVFDNQHCVPRIHQSIEHFDERPYVVKVESCGWLVHDVETAFPLAAGPR